MNTPTMLHVELNADSRIETAHLDSMDRCDRCSSAALVRAVKDSFTLLFCGHHANRSAAGLIEKGWKLDDQTSRMFPEANTGNSDTKSTSKLSR